MANHAAARHRTWRQRAVIGVNAIACVTCFVLTGVLSWSWHRVREIPRIDLGHELAAADVGEVGDSLPQNVLIVGTDSADGLPDDDPIRVGRDAGVRTDTLMLLRIDPSAEQATLLSLPRDLYVPIAGTSGSARINNAIQGGPARLVATVTDALDLPVHHYVEVDFAGFRELVDAIGGVPVYFPEPVRDLRSGLEVPEAGCVNLDPVQALAYARARAYEVFRDGRWDVDGSGDLGRISRQQDFIRRALHRAFQRGARNPAVLAELVDTAVGAITLDSTLTISDLSAIALRFRNFDPAALQTLGLPVTDAVIDGADVLRLDRSAAQPILDLFRGRDPHEVAPDNTVVEVRNGSSTVGAAEEAAAALRALGFVVPPDATGDADSAEVAQTTVQYREGAEREAALVAGALATDPALDGPEELVGADIRVVIGADFPGVGTTIRALDPALLPGLDAAPAISVTTTSAPPTVTPTTANGEVPVPPPGATC